MTLHAVRGKHWALHVLNHRHVLAHLCPSACQVVTFCSLILVKIGHYCLKGVDNSINSTTDVMLGFCFPLTFIIGGRIWGHASQPSVAGRPLNHLRTDEREDTTWSWGFVFWPTVCYRPMEPVSFSLKDAGFLPFVADMSRRLTLEVLDAAFTAALQS